MQLESDMGTSSDKGGNFANDPERAREAGRKGGEQSHGSGRSGSSQGGKGGNFAQDKQKASDAGRKGGEHSHGGGNR